MVEGALMGEGGARGKKINLTFASRTRLSHQGVKHSNKRPPF